MGRAWLLVVTLLCGILGATSIEIPICTASGDQLYPDVCWDGEAFWVVWQDEELGTIRGRRVSEDGEFLADEVELLNSGTFPGPMSNPVVATGPDRIAVEARIMVGYNEFGSKLWRLIHNEYTFDGNPLYTDPFWMPPGDYEYGKGSTPCLLYGNDHFFSFHKHSFETPVDEFARTLAWGFHPELEFAYRVWDSSEGGGQYLPPIACWNGEKFLVFFQDEIEMVHRGVFLTDSLFRQGVGGNILLERHDFFPHDNGYQTLRYQSLVAAGSRYLLVSENEINFGGKHIGFDILDSTGMPVNDSARIIDLSPGIRCYYPDVIMGGNNYVAVWENRFDDETVHLYAIEVDTLGLVLDSGYVTFNNPVEQHPTLAFNGEKYLLAWTDNREGEFNIYGMLFDTLELKEGIKEQNLPIEVLSPIIAQPDIFTTATTLYLSNYIMDKKVTLKIYDNTGSLVRRLILPKGERSVVWNGNDERGRALCAGVYFVMPGGTKVRAARVIKLQ